MTSSFNTGTSVFGLSRALVFGADLYFLHVSAILAVLSGVQYFYEAFVMLNKNNKTNIS